MRNSGTLVRALTTIVVVATPLLTATPVAAQDGLLASCAATRPSAPGAPQSALDQVEPQLRFLCGQVVTAVSDVQPTIGIAFSGGAHTLGTATTLGRRFGVLPRLSVTARFNAALATMPDLLDGFDATIGTDGQVPAMGTVRVPVGSLQGDVTVGLFNGFSPGPMIGGLGALDLLGSVSYVPAVERVGLDSEIINVGIGARVGILQQGLVMPGVSVSGMYRTMLGDVAFGDLASDDPAEFTTDLSTVSLRAGVSKGFLAVDLAAGAGYDIYTSNVAFDFELECPASECGERYVLSPIGPDGARGVRGDLSTAAWNVHANAGLSLLLLHAVAELGYQKATSVVGITDLRDAGIEARSPTREELEGGRFFASLGLRLSF